MTTSITASAAENSKLYAVTPLNDIEYLVEIDPATGDVKQVLELKPPYTPFQSCALAFSPDGELYGIAGIPSTELFKIDLNTGEIKVIGSLNITGISDWRSIVKEYTVSITTDIWYK